MDFMDFAKDVIEDNAIKNLCSKSKSFAAFNKIQSILVFMAENKIDPASEQGQHCLLDLNFAVNEYNQVFIEHGLNPQLNINCERI